MTAFEYFGVVEEDDEEVVFAEEKRHGNRGRPSAQCLCGRFAKYLGTQHYYNGNFDCARMSVECSRCGTVDIELV